MITLILVFDLILLIDSVLLIWLTKVQFLKTVEIQLLEKNSYGINSIISIFLILLSTVLGTFSSFMMLFPKLNLYILEILGAVK